ncbi:MAG: SDR family oxidoreductase [Acetobacteraceae bacterium]|nr:SDR family oxidoreductase [Acetobacteraceae bacterium]
MPATATQRVAIVTGGAKGIGGAMVRGLLGAGVAVVAADRDAPALDALAEDVGAEARERLLTHAADLTAPGAAEALVEAARGRFGKVDILVNNAGIGMGTIRPDNWQNPIKFWEVTPEQWRRFLEVNATIAFLLSRIVAPEMMRQGFGRIVNITTSLGTMMRAGSPTYGPSKAAFEALAAIMATDLQGTGVTCNVLVPGGVTNTSMVPLQAGFDRARMFQPEIMVPPLLWLVSDDAGGVTARRFLAAHWDTALPPEQAAERAGAPIAWTALAVLPIVPT